MVVLEREKIKRMNMFLRIEKRRKKDEAKSRTIGRSGRIETDD